MARTQISALPHGVHKFTDHLDDDGINPDSLQIMVTIPLQSDELTADFAGTSSQVKGGINYPLSFTQSATYACVRCLMDQYVPNNNGYFRPITVIAQEGTIVNPSPPAPCLGHLPQLYLTACQREKLAAMSALWPSERWSSFVF